MQQYTPIQAALDTQLQTINTGSISGLTSVSYIEENDTFSLANIANPTGMVFLRTTLIPFSPQTATIGLNGYDHISGVFAIDVMGQLDQGYTLVKQVSDVVIAAFPRGMIVALSNSEQVTIETTGLAPNITQGAWAMNRLYCVQVQVKWFGYMNP